MPEVTREVAHIGKSVVIKGELSGSEDLFLDGQVEGSIVLEGNRLTVGPNGKIKAKVQAKSVVVQGNIEGSVQGSERVELGPTATMTGDIVTKRMVMQEGAYLKGSVTPEGEAKS